MADFFEIDFLDVESDKSGDAICLRYSLAGAEYIHIVDGGFQSTGDSMIAHIKKYYSNAPYVDHVVATHHDGDHTGGLRRILEELKVGALWMLCPWHYADELLPRFETYSSAVALRAKLRSLYPNLAALEDIAKAKRIPVLEAFQGTKIGAFTVLTPSKARYLDLIVASDRTPQAAEAHSSMLAILEKALVSTAKKVVNLVKMAWGVEVFSTNETSCENEMSVVQFATLWSAVKKEMMYCLYG